MRMFRNILLAGVLLLLIACAEESVQDGRISGGQGESFVLECAADKPCPDGYQCVAQAGQASGNCVKNVAHESLLNFPVIPEFS